MSREQEFVQLFHVAELAPRNIHEISKRLHLSLDPGAEDVSLQTRSHSLVFDLQIGISGTAPWEGEHGVEVRPGAVHVPVVGDDDHAREPPRVDVGVAQEVGVAQGVQAEPLFQDVGGRDVQVEQSLGAPLRVIKISIKMISHILN